MRDQYVPANGTTIPRDVVKHILLKQNGATLEVLKQKQKELWETQTNYFKQWRKDPHLDGQKKMIEWLIEYLEAEGANTAASLTVPKIEPIKIHKVE